MKNKRIACIGAALVDESYRCNAEPLPGTSNPAAFYRSPGGVARNISHHLALLGNSVELITHFGNDTDGQWLMEQCQTSGIGISHALVNDVGTGRYVAMLSPDGNLFAGAVSTHFEQLITPAFLQSRRLFLKEASLIQMDCNLSTESLNWLIGFCREENIPCIIEPVSVPKAARLMNIDLSNVLLITPNQDEMVALTGETGNHHPDDLVKKTLEKGVKNLWVRNGKDGSVLYNSDLSFKLKAPPANVKDNTGAGDAALAGWIHAWLQEKNPELCVRCGHAMASLVLEVNGAINKDINADLLEETIKILNLE